MGRWIWVVGYLLVAGIIFLVGTSVSEVPLYKQMRVPYFPRATVAQAAVLLGIFGSFFVFWLMGRRFSMQFWRGGWKQAYAGTFLYPLWTLLVVAGGQHVLLDLLRPFLSVKEFGYARWVAVGAVGAAAIWFCVVLVRSLPALIDLLKSGFVSRLVEAAARRCGDCGTPIVEGGRFCHRCGAAG